jgi:hypothetical protein
VVVFDERANLRANGSTIEAHHKELAHLPGIATWLVSTIMHIIIAASGVETSRRGNSLNRPSGAFGVPQGREELVGVGAVDVQVDRSSGKR